jgi:hypothetical protein
MKTTNLIANSLKVLQLSARISLIDEDELTLSIHRKNKFIETLAFVSGLRFLYHGIPDRIGYIPPLFWTIGLSSHSISKRVTLSQEKNNLVLHDATIK